MTIKKKPKRGKHTIDLTGPSGNAFALLGAATALCRRLGKDYNKISEDMKSGDYEHLIKVFNREFGEYVDLLR